jgi:hypothetical protein
LPALTRRAMAWPIAPAPMTTVTLFMLSPYRPTSFCRSAE